MSARRELDYIYKPEYEPREIVVVRLFIFENMVAEVTEKDEKKRKGGCALCCFPKKTMGPKKEYVTKLRRGVGVSIIFF